MASHLVHTCIRVRDIVASVRFYEALGFEHRGRLNFETAYNVYLGLPGDGDKLELTVNDDRTEPYDLGDGYNHVALVVDDLDQQLADLKAQLGVEPEKPAFHPGGRDDLPLIAFVQDPDGYRIELIDGAFPTPQDPDER
jgi:lactoylglutathione lyase